MRAFSLDQLLQLVSLPELENLDVFVTSFMEESVSSSWSSLAKELRLLLQCYERSWSSTSSKMAAMERHLELVKLNEPNLWQLDNRTVTSGGQCRDERRVTAAHVYTVARFESELNKRVNEAMKGMREILAHSFSLTAHEMMLSKLKIDCFVFDMCKEKSLDEAVVKSVLAVFFDFVNCINKDSSKESQQRSRLNQHVQQWLNALVATLIVNRVSVGCHLHLLLHILKLPKGVITQYAHYVHLPLQPEFPDHLDHAFTVLRVVLTPVKHRRVLVNKKAKSKEIDTDDKWTVIDSEGDETDEDDNDDERQNGINKSGSKENSLGDDSKYCRLKESDLIALLNQVPMSKLFESMFKVGQCNDEEGLSLSSMPKLLALNTRLVLILRDGLCFYKSPKWRRLAKILARLIRHVLQYVGDEWQLVMKRSEQDDAMVKRVQMEYERFFLRCVHCLFLHSNSGWQHLAMLDFNLVSTNMLAKMFYLLHLVHADQRQWELLLDSDEDSGVDKLLSSLDSSDVRLQFEEKLSSLRDASHHFLLTSMAIMATSRNTDCYEARILVRCVLVDLMHMGFVNPMLSQECSKLITDLIITITLKHSWLLSMVVERMLKLTSNPSVFNLAKQLPFKLYEPSNEDLDLLIKHLVEDTVESAKNQLTRLILSGINFDPECSLSLPMAQKLALGILKASLRLDVSMLSMNMLQTSRQQELFVMWAYETLSRLHLHPLDNDSSAAAAIRGEMSVFQSTMIDFDIDPRMEELAKAIVVNNDPIAVYIALNTTQVGQSVPEILQRGFGFMLLLAKNGRFDHLLECLSHISPLFIHCSNHLASNENFISVLKAILNEDQTLVKRAKELVYNDWPGPITRELANLIAFQMASFKKYGEASSVRVMSMWLECMTSVPNFNRDRNALFIVDLLLREAFCDEDSYQTAKSVLLACIERSRKRENGLGLFSWFSSSSSEKVFESSYGSQFGFYAFFMLELEWLEHRAMFTDLMDSMGEEVGLEEAFRMIVKEDNRTVRDALPIYRWSQQILDCNVDHPLMPIFAQKFFTFYLWRPGMDSNEGLISPSKGLGPLFFGGYLNGFYFNKLLTKFKAISDHYASECESSHNRKLNLLFNTAVKWLEDESVLNPSFHVNSLSAALQPHKLEAILNRSTDLWLDEVDMDALRQPLLTSRNEWARLHFRTETLLPSSPCVTELDPLGRIVKRLQSYDDPKLPPNISDIKSPTQSVAVDAFRSIDNLKEKVDKPVAILTSLAEQFSLDISALSSCCCHLSELLPCQYNLVSKELVVHACCSGSSTKDSRKRSVKVPCKGAAVIVLKFDESCSNEEISFKIKEKRALRDRVQSKLMDLEDNHAQVEAVQLEQLVSKLVGCLRTACHEHNFDEVSRLSSMGRWLFFHLADVMSESLLSCPYVKSIFSKNLDVLGQAFIAERSECVLDLLHYIIQNQLCFDLLVSSFTPNAANTETFMEVYGIIAGMKESRSNAAFVLLSKMSIGKWLSDCRPRVQERSRLISLIGQAMKTSTKKELQLGLYRKHLMLLASFEYPVHLNEIFSMLLDLTENQSLIPEVWLDFINALLAMDKRRLSVRSLDDDDLIDVIREFAASQDFCTPEEIQACTRVANNHFSLERRRVGLFGIYTKYSKYTKALAAIFSLFGHLRIVMAIRERGAAHETLISSLWQELRSTYDPWLTPLTLSTRSDAPTWIENMADKPLLPFAPEESHHAKLMLNSLCSTINLIQDVSINGGGILSHVWEYYVRSFADNSVPDHIVHVVHTCFIASLSWGCFMPREQDLELMVRVLDAFLPLSHAFVGQVFNQTSWTNLNDDENNDQRTSEQDLGTQKRLRLVLKIVVKLAAEPHVRQSGRLLSQLRASEKWPWWLVDADSFESLVQWYVLSVDCRVILAHKDRHPLDAAVLSLLQRASCLVSETCELPASCSEQKRLMFVRCVTRLLSACSNKHKSFLSANLQLLQRHLKLLLETIELVINQYEEASVRLTLSRPLIRELLLLLNGPPKGPTTTTMLDTLLTWLGSHTSSHSLLTAIMETCGEAVRKPVSLAMLSEACLEAYFRDDDDQSYEHICDVAMVNKESSRDVWQVPLAKLNVNDKSNNLTKMTLDVCVEHGFCLMLYLHLRRQRPKCLSLNDEAVLISTLLDWLRHLKISEENESKLPLLYSFLLRLCQRQLDLGGGERLVVDSLINFTLTLSPLIKDKTWNLLGVVGLVSQYTPSPRARFLATSLVLLIRSQIYDDGRLHLRIRPQEASTSTIKRSGDLKSDYDDALDVIALRDRLVVMKSQKSYLGLADLIDFVLTKSEDEESDFRTLHSSLASIVTDKLYVDTFHASLPFF